ncbi:glycerate kinase [Tolumonas auensis DSM 9187]|uniref:Glycerate kinase n=1 Tax=Tolumonas auensis (strain DSM 9187 / NBRC 110442 / TA 4) TaxID=595494 RepID=C4LAJ8_TOLAT|nr:glycerate kinase [Tolumonas auensis]ACQ94173.1 glycerate kinase [Tolumonas auensis DSM 9187]
MKIVIAPDSYKESLSAMEVAIQIEAGFREIYPDAEYIKLPVADGGEGTVDAMVAATGGRQINVSVTGPTGKPVLAHFGITGNQQCAVIEMASASGLECIPPEERNPLITTSYGTGELIKAALDLGVTEFIIGLGGSATNDGGAGMLQALGIHLLDKAGHNIGKGGQCLSELEYVDVSGMDPRLKQCRITVACDVTNPLTGPQGASAIFGPQKGANPAMVRFLDENLKHYAEVIARQTGKDVEFAPGAGAAGGLGAALLAFLNAELRSGIEIVTEAVELEKAIMDADLVITGEGRIDSQSIKGKVPVGVARLAKRHNKPVIGIAGSLSADVAVVYEHGIDCVFSVLNKVCSLDEALNDAAANVRLTARNIAATLRLLPR